MNKVGLVVHLEAKPGREQELLQLLTKGENLVREEARTPVWFAFRDGQSGFGIFDAFPDTQARQAHLAGKLASALMARAGELLAKDPSIREVDVLAEKVA